jgi:hypothetical protein
MGATAAGVVDHHPPLNAPARASARPLSLLRCIKTEHLVWHPPCSLLRGRLRMFRNGETRRPVTCAERR